VDEYIEYSSWKDWLYTGCFICSNLLYHLALCIYVYIYYNIDFVLCTAYFVFVLTFPHPGLYWIYGNKDDDDDDDGGGGGGCSAPTYTLPYSWRGTKLNTESTLPLTSEELRKESNRSLVMSRS
jgi:hypothetical protein